MEKKKEKFTLIVDFRDGKHCEYDFDNFNEYLSKKNQLLHDKNVINFCSHVESTYTRREEPFNQGLIIEKLRSEFHERCHGKDCFFCRYNGLGSNCFAAFIVDHYENNGGNNND